MTIAKVQHKIDTYFGLSTDTKPTTNVAVGSQFRENDTHSWFMWDGFAWGVMTNIPLADNVSVALLPSAARTTTQTSADLINTSGERLQVILDVTSAGTGSVTVTILGKDPASGKYYLLLSGAAVVANSTVVYRVGPGLTAAANAASNDMVPRVFQIVVTANNANPVTYSVGYNLGD